MKEISISEDERREILILFKLLLDNDKITRFEHQLAVDELNTYKNSLIR
jgi:hypothetical protein